MRDFNRRVFTQFLLGTTLLGSLPARLLAATRRAPDLIVETLQWSEDAGDTWHAEPVADGGDLLFQAVISNVGHMSVPNKLVRVEFLVDGELVDEVEQLSGLAAGEQLTLTGLAPWRAEAGSYRVSARVDPGDLVRSEESEANNQVDLALEVLALGALAAVNDAGEPHCPISEEQKSIAKMARGKSEEKTWKEDAKADMVRRMKTENGIPEATAAALAERAVEDRIDSAVSETLAVQAVSASASLVGLGMAVTRAISIAAAGLLGGPVGFAIAAADTMVGMALSRGENVQPATMVGYSTGTGGQGALPPGLPTTVSTVANTNFAGTTAAKAATAARVWGWAVRYYGNFGNITVMGDAGMINTYRRDGNRLRSQFYMYWGSAKFADMWVLSMFLGGFMGYSGTSSPNGGHMDPNDAGRAYVLLIVLVALLAFFVGGQLWSGVLFLTQGFLVLMDGPKRIPSLPAGLCGTIAIGCAACGL